MALRSSRHITKSMQTFKELEKNMLPLNSNVVGHYFYLRNQLNVLSIWTKASFPVLSKQRIEANSKGLIDRYNALRKK